MKVIGGGVTAAKGYTASGIHCGIRKNKDKRDLALIVSSKRAAAASVYTSNLVQGAPLAVTKRNLADGYASALICNSGNANTCNRDGVEIAETMCLLVEAATGIAHEDVIVASTGVIGQTLDLTPIKKGMKKLVAALGDHSAEAAEAIMTTDLLIKQTAVTFTLGEKVCTLGGIAKGSGMINPNMATMLAFLTTDVAISPSVLQQALAETVKDTFNMISVDGDTSTNDMVSVLANGLAENVPITATGQDYETFTEALYTVMECLAKGIARDGEGATKLITCTVAGASSKEDARKVAKTVISSSLVKAAMLGSDANWGRVLCAVGYAGVDLDVNAIDVAFSSKAGTVKVCANGRGIDFSETLAKTVLSTDAVTILVGLNAGSMQATAWGCDLTQDYVVINSDYRT